MAKDEPTALILETLQRVEMKLESMSSASGRSQCHGQTPSWSSSQDSQQTPSSSSSRRQLRSGQQIQDESPTHLHTQKRLSLTVPHKVIFWPMIYSRLVSTRSTVGADLHAMSESGTPWLVKQETDRNDRNLPFADGLPFVFTANPTPGQSIYNSGVSFPSVTVKEMEYYSNAYFHTFNALYPILDHDVFMSSILKPLLQGGFAYGDSPSVLALMVLALGNLATASIAEKPMAGLGAAFHDEIEQPPGLQFFNEARARVGSVGSGCDLISVQIPLLIATYLEANGRHMEFWRWTVAASMTCQVLVLSFGDLWDTYQGDMIKRAYWTCVVNEDLYHLDLDLTRTSVREFEDVVPLPHFQSALSRDDAEASKGSDPMSNSQYHFLAKASLKRTISRIHDSVYLHSNQSETIDDYRSPPDYIIRELSHQLESWRTLLPSPLQWSDDDIYGEPEAEEATSTSSAEGGGEDVVIQAGQDVLTAELRARFYYARFILYRPFVFKAMHFPRLLSKQDEDCCAYAIQAACSLPVTLAPTKTRKRLIPHLFTWTQNFVGILLILWASEENENMRRICAARLDSSMIPASMGLMLEWLQDVQMIDGTAKWSWRLLEPLFPHGV